MALIKCLECGKEISDTVKSCPHCGYVNKSTFQKVKMNKNAILKIAISVILVTVLLLVVSIFSRPNLKFKDLDVENNAISTFFLLGIPDEIEDNEWEYGDCGIEFYDIPVEKIWFNIADGEYYLLFDSEYNDAVESVLSKYCKKSNSVYGFDVYTYEDVEVWASFYSTSGNLQIHK